MLMFLSTVFLLACSSNDVLPNTALPVIKPTRFSIENHTISGNQKIDIYIPPEYDSTEALPIIYFNDGDNYAQIFNILTLDYPEPFIMVGVYAGNTRKDKYIPYEDAWISQNWGTYTPNAANYSKTFVEEIIPYVEERFLVDESRRAIFGMSLGGLHATWIGLKYPQYFSFVGALSPSFWVDDYAIIGEPVSDLTRSNRFYFDMGTREWNYYVPFINTLKNGNLRYGKEIFYYEVFGGTHDGGAWGGRIQIPFLLFLNKGSPSGGVSYELFVECIPSVVTAGLFFQRLNPVISFEDGTKYSLTTEANYEIVDGSGEVTYDGRFEVSGSGSMTVKVSFGSWSKKVDLDNCF